MPKLSLWMLRAALLYLLLGLALGLLLLAGRGGFVSMTVWRWQPMHIECMMVGWCGHLVLGVGYWMLPRFGQGLRPRSWLAWLSFVLLNLGLLVVLLAPPEGKPLGRALETLAWAAMTLHLWPRIKSFSA